MSGREVRNRLKQSAPMNYEVFLDFILLQAV